MTDKAARFDRAAWASGAAIETSPNPRRDMVEAARAAGVAAGSDRAFVRDLLGRPDASSEAVDRWSLGRAELTPDFQQLVVEYDADDMVTRAAVRKQ